MAASSVPRVPLEPWLVGWLVLAALLTRQARLPGFQWTQVAASVMVAGGIALYAAAAGPRPWAPALTTFTMLLLAVVGAATAVLGTGLAWLVAGHDFPGRGLFAWALLLPLAVPGYVLAVVFAGALDFAGPLQGWLRESVHAGLRLPPIRSLGGAALVLSLCLYPYVYLLARVAFETAGARTLEAAQTLGLDRRAAFRRAVLPLARPAIAAGVGLVCMETLADFGVVAALNVDTFTTAIYRAWFGMYSIAAALQMAALLALLALAGVWIERRLRGGRGFASQRPSGALQRVRLTGVRAALASLAAATVIGIAFALPRVPAQTPDLWASLLTEIGLMLARTRDRTHAERLRLRIDEFSHPRAELARAELMRANGKRREAIGLFHTNLAYYRVGGRRPSILLASESLARLLESENATQGAIQMLEEMAGPRTATYSAETLGSSGWAWLRCQRELVRLYRKAGKERRANEIQAEIRLLLSQADPAVKALNEARPQ